GNSTPFLAIRTRFPRIQPKPEAKPARLLSPTQGLPHHALTTDHPPCCTGEERRLGPMLVANWDGTTTCAGSSTSLPPPARGGHDATTGDIFACVVFLRARCHNTGHGGDVFRRKSS